MFFSAAGIRCAGSVPAFEEERGGLSELVEGHNKSQQETGDRLLHVSEGLV